MEVMIPPWVRPESPETIRIIDDATVAFQPAFGRGMTQRGIFADPRWGLRRRYRGLRSDEKAAILNALNETRGQLNTLRVVPHTPLRGSFPSTEIFANNQFSNGTTGWTPGSEYTLSVSDRVLRAVRNAMTGAARIAQMSALTVTQYAPYVARFMVMQGRGFYPAGFRIENSDNIGPASVGFGLKSQAFVTTSTTDSIVFEDVDTTGLVAGDYVSVPFTSYARCALIDNGANLLLQSDALGTSWSPTAASVLSNTLVDPLGTSTADSIVDTGANTTHYVNQAVSVASAVADYAFCVALKGGQRNFAFIQMSEGGGGTSVSIIADLNTGALGTSSTGAGWSNLRAFIVNMGNGWWKLCLVARKTSSSTTITSFIGPAASSSTTAYAGASGAATYSWRATLSQSSVPVRLVQTTTVAVAASAQSGNGIHTKGWPASVTGTLLRNDWVEINGELKQLTDRVDTDAAGLAYIQFRPGLAGAPADNDPIVINEPMGRFIYPGTREFENLFGIYGDCEMNLEEVYS